MSHMLCVATLKSIAAVSFVFELPKKKLGLQSISINELNRTEFLLSPVSSDYFFALTLFNDRLSQLHLQRSNAS